MAAEAATSSFATRSSRVKRARNPDAVGLTLLEDFLHRVKARGVHVLLCGVRTDFAQMLDRTGITAHLGEVLKHARAVCVGGDHSILLPILNMSQNLH